MNSKCIFMLIACTSNIGYAHQISTASVRYTIQQTTPSAAKAVYDIMHGVVQYTSPDGTPKLPTKAHMARTAPWNAQEILGKITIDMANDFAGTWYIYR